MEDLLGGQPHQATDRAIPGRGARSVLILSADWDYHAAAVAWGLRRVGSEVVLLDASRFPGELGASIGFGEQGVDRLHFAGADIEAQRIGAVWCRRPLQTHDVMDYSRVHPDDIGQVHKEVESFVTGAYHLLEWHVLAHADWYNGYGASMRAKSKALQIATAIKAGLRVPPTLMSSVPSEVRAFADDQAGGLIVKPFRPKKWNVKGRGVGQPTLRLQPHHLEMAEAIAACPAIYQPELEKAYELRVVYTDGRIFACKIDSQSHEHTRLDWRLDVVQRAIGMVPFELPADVAASVKAFMRGMGLRMGSIDLIVDKQGQHYFLEVNEQGQFLFIDEQCPGANVLARVVDLLAGCEGASELGVSLASYEQSADFASLMERIRHFEEQRRPVPELAFPATEAAQ